MKRRVVSLWLTHFPVDRLTREQGTPLQDSRHSPLVTTADSHDRQIVAATGRAAEQAGIAAGMTLANARAIQPALRAVPADPATDRLQLDRLATWCRRYTPWAATDGTDGIFLDITGCAHLFGGEAALCRDLARRVKGIGFAARLALADTPGAAWAVARYGRDGSVVPPGEIAAALVPLPAAALRLDDETVTALFRVGIRRIGELHVMPRAPLAARFGTGVARRLDQAFGALREPISPQRPGVPFRSHLECPEPIARQEDIATGLDRLLAELCQQLGTAGYGARRLSLSLYRVDGEVFEIAVGAARPSGDAPHLARLFGERLGGFDPGFGIEAMTLTAPVSEPLPAASTKPLLVAEPGHGDRDALLAQDLAPLIDRLGNRVGFDRVVRLGAVASHLPERAARPMPALAGPLRFDWPDGPPRPLRLFERPERIDAIPPDHDDSPPERFRWRRVDHRVRAAEGPERIAPEWWAEAPPSLSGTRDYWRVEDESGRRFWIFRHTLPRRSHAPEWFLHGLFA
jgi:protein ImuB